MKYKINKEFSTFVGFPVNSIDIMNAVEEVNDFLYTLPANLYKNIDYKTTGAMIGAIFCSKIAEAIPESIVNPIEKGYPDIIPLEGANESEEILKNIQLA